MLAVYAAIVAFAVVCGAFIARPWLRRSTQHA
jgi:hypothetical protein